MNPSTLDYVLNSAKSIAAFLGAMITLAVTLTTLPAWVAVVGVLLTAAAVYQIPNRPLPVAYEEAETPEGYVPERAAEEPIE